MTSEVRPSTSSLRAFFVSAGLEAFVIPASHGNVFHSTRVFPDCPRLSAAQVQAGRCASPCRTWEGARSSPGTTRCFSLGSAATDVS